MRSSMKIVAVTAVALLATGCNMMKGKETAGQSVDDATIAARAKAALVKDSTVSATDFNIDVYKGNVTLTGVAKTPDEVKRAVDDIKHVPGVVSVKNAARVATADRGENKSE
ncbi:MAG TPA: BON domain-containing protein [Steroidobacteraceae bacterium]|jgi:osmotically-inducible protein OsmY|nr:BON domain-containing protein [Steroidobacteraceae bacterium]